MMRKNLTSARLVAIRLRRNKIQPISVCGTELPTSGMWDIENRLYSILLKSRTKIKIVGEMSVVEMQQ